MFVPSQASVNVSWNTVVSRSARAGRRALAVVTILLLCGGVAMAQGGGSDQGRSGAGDELDLREANVTGVTIETNGTGAYRFNVTLIHDDDGEDGYANWWQVESLDGTQLGRRELLHAHGTVEFTRSASIEIPDGTNRVIVRGHDQTHGYGGQIAIVELESGAIEFVGQGSDLQGFGDRQ